MEKWQRNHIVQNLPQLIETTDCNDFLLTTLRSESILSAEDVQDLQNKGTDIKNSHYLYNLLPKREGSYNALISALKKTCQSGAVKILLTGYISYRIINFQGSVSLLSELLPNLDETLIQELVGLEVEHPWVDEVIVKNTIPCKLDYYIPRTIVSRRKLDKLVFQEKCSDVFLFQGLEWNELSLLANGLPTDVSSDLLDPLQQHTIRYVLLESLEHFDIIAEKTNEPVHFIQHVNGAYKWIKSSGAVETILKFVEEEPDLMKENSFIEEVLNDDISVCLTDSPGMGKTVLLANISKAIVDRHPQRLVIFVYLFDLIPALQANLTTGRNLDCQLIQTLLSEHASEHPVGKHLARHMLANDYTYLCFDGFDEVPPEHIQLTKAMLKLIAKSFKKIKMFVTARLHMRQELEQTMGTLGFHIAPFNMDNQIEFLVKFWKSRGAVGDHLTEYAETCLTTLAAEISKDEQDIAGIPLQCFMIGEVFLDRAKSHNSSLILGNEVPITPMAQLFNVLINTKLDTLTDGGKRESFIQAHIHSAMALLFPEEGFNHLEYPKGISCEQICRVGIMEQTGSVGGMRFVHRTFAEFFVALFTARLPHKLDNESVQFILEKVLSTYGSHEYLIDNPLGRQYLGISATRMYQHPVIAYFLNFHLRLQNTKIHSNVHIKLEESQRVLLNFLLAAISNDSVEIFGFYIELFEKYQSHTLLNFEWLYYLQLMAAKHSDKYMLEKIFELSKKIHSYDVQGTLDYPLFVACHCGNYKNLEYFLRQNKSITDAKYVLHFCIWYSSCQPDAVIKRKLQIIKYLTRRFSFVLHEQLDGLTPILGKEIHLELLLCTLKSGARVNDMNEDLKSVLHITPKYMSSIDYHNLINFILKFFDNKLLTKRDAFGCTPLHYAVEYLPILSDTLEIFLSHGTDINVKDNKGNSVIFYAVRYQTESTLELLNKNGAKLDDKNLMLETAWHIASNYANTSALNWLIKQGANEEALDAAGAGISSSKQTLSLGHQNTAECKNVLVPNDIKVSPKTNLKKNSSFSNIQTNDMIKFQKKNTSMHIAFCQKNVDIENIKFLFRLNANFNAQNTDGDTPFHLGVLNAEISKNVLEFAVKVGGADLNIVNNYGFSVLAQATYGGKDVSFLKLLVEYGADVCRVSNFEAAIRCENLSHVKFLLEQGADINKVSGEGQENLVALTFQLHKWAHFEIAKCLITSTPQLNFDDQKEFTRIVYWALLAYKESLKFRTAKLLNLLASHGLDFAHYDATVRYDNPVFFHVVKDLSLAHTGNFLKHIVQLGYTSLGKLKNRKSQNVVQYFMVSTQADFPIKLLPLLGNVSEILNSGDKNGFSVLIYAIRFGKSVEYIKLLIANGADVNHLDKNGASLLHHAAWKGKSNCVEYFVDQVRDKNCVEIDGSSALHWAFDKETQNFDNVKTLIKKGVSVNLENLSGTRIIDSALEAYEKWENFKCADIFILMLSHGFDVESKGRSGSPILYEIMSALIPEHCEEILKHLYQINKTQCFHIRGKDGESLLHRCIQQFEPSPEMMSIFKCVDVNARNLNLVSNSGFSVLAQAIIAKRDLSFLKLLIDYGADVCQPKNFQAAFETSDLKYVMFIFEHAVGIIEISHGGQNAKPIPTECIINEEAYFEIVKCRISSKPGGNFKQRNYITNLFSWALETFKNSEKVRTDELFNLLAYYCMNFAHSGPNMDPVLFSVMQYLDINHSESFLKHLIRTGYTDVGALKNRCSMNVLQYILVNSKTVFPMQLLPLLGDLNTILNSKDDNSRPVLTYAIKFSSSVEYMKQLIEHGADVNHLDKNGASLLHHAASKGDLTCVDFLVDQVKDKNCVDNDGDSVLHYAFNQVADKQFNVVKLLISKGVTIKQHRLFLMQIANRYCSA